MSRTRSEILYNREDHRPLSRELHLRKGVPVVLNRFISSADGNSNAGWVETVGSDINQPVVLQLLTNMADGKILQHSELYRKQVRSRYNGEIIGTFENVYDWTRRSITLFARELLVVGGTKYPLHHWVDSVPGPPRDTVPGPGMIGEQPVNRYFKITFPYDVEIYDPDDPGYMGADIAPLMPVEFINWDGTVLKFEMVPRGYDATPPEDPVRIGHRFEGWSEDHRNVQRPLVLYAVMPPIMQYVVWKDWDGTILKEEYVPYGQPGNPPAPVRVGYNFIGWNNSYSNVVEDSEFITIYDSSEMIATYEQRIYTITWLGAGGEYITKTRVPHGESALQPIISDTAITTLLRPPEGKSFGGWSWQNTGDGWDIYEVISDKTVTVIWMTTLWRVYFVGYLGEILKMEWVPHASAATPPSLLNDYPHLLANDPYERGCYEFIRWDTAFNAVRSDLVVKAIYLPRQYYVTFLGRNNQVLRESMVLHGGQVLPPKPPDVTNMKFVRWNLAQGTGPLPELIIGDTKFQAVYRENIISVTLMVVNGVHSVYHLLSGRSLASVGVSLPTVGNFVSGDGAVSHRWNGRWYTSSGDFTANTVVHVDTIVYADYTETGNW